MEEVHVTHFLLRSMHSQYEEREGRKEKTAMYINHTMPQEDVGCACYSRSVMFHAFAAVRRENTAVISKINTTHITGACGRMGLTS